MLIVFDLNWLAPKRSQVKISAGGADNNNMRIPVVNPKYEAVSRFVGSLPSKLRRELVASQPRKTALAIFDQAIVSGVNFLTAIAVGRICGVSEFGVYSLAFTILILLATAQEALVLSPYTVYCGRLNDRRQIDYAGSALVQYAAVVLIATCVLLIIAGCLAVSELTTASTIALILAVIVPFTLLREFARRWSFAHLRIGEAVILDATMAGIQLIGLAVLVITQQLTAVSALVLIGIAGAVSGGAWFCVRRKRFRLRRKRLRLDALKNLRLGRWMLASRMTSVVHGNCVHWLLAWLIGVAATGGFAACYTIMAAFNPILMGIGSLLAPQTAQAFADGGRPQLRHVVWRATVLVTAGTAVFTGILTIFGGKILVLVFGPEFSELGPTLAVLAFALLASIVGMGPDNGLRAIERPDVNFVASLIGLGVSVIAAGVMIPWWGILGGAGGLLIGTFIAAGVRCFVFARIVQDS